MSAYVQPQRPCAQCAALLPPDAERCPRCGARPTPRPSSAPAQGGDAAGDSGAPAGEERRSLSCRPHDLESVARAEAVDGWTLVDTTVDPDAAGKILAHFRRPRRQPSAPSSATTASSTTSSGTERTHGGQAHDGPADGDATRAPAQRASEEAPASKRTGRRERRRAAKRARRAAKRAAWRTRRSSRDIRSRREVRFVYGLCLLVSMLVLVRVMGIVPGLFIGFFVLPGVLRKALGI